MTADAHLSIKSTVWTLGGGYRVVDLPEASLSLVAGTRALFLNQHLNFQFSGDVGSFVGPGRQGSGDSNPTNWDGIIGFKGEFRFGDRRQWFVPYYFDVGTGGSELTWQASPASAISSAGETSSPPGDTSIISSPITARRLP